MERDYPASAGRRQEEREGKEEGGEKKKRRRDEERQKKMEERRGAEDVAEGIAKVRKRQSEGSSISFNMVHHIQEKC